MPFAALRCMSNLLPLDGKLVLRRQMPFRLGLPPRIAAFFGFPVRPMPHAVRSAFCDHYTTPIAADGRLIIGEAKKAGARGRGGLAKGLMGRGSARARGGKWSAESAATVRARA